MRLAALVVVVAAAAAHAGKKTAGSVVLNGQSVDVAWSDGDSFKIKSGVYKGKNTRMQGYNTLEAFGPVHQWGDWSARELFQIALDAGPAAGSKVWDCTTDGKLDGYGRLLILCPDLVKHMVGGGWAMVYAIEGSKPDPEALALQQKAIAEKLGMWRKGSAKGIITSLHSIDEDGGKNGTAYNRVVDTRDGSAMKREHQNTYKTCQQVCETTDGDTSCMIYVPFDHRYKDKPDCLR